MAHHCGSIQLAFEVSWGDTAIETRVHVARYKATPSARRAAYVGPMASSFKASHEKTEQPPYYLCDYPAHRATQWPFGFWQ